MKWTPWPRTISRHSITHSAIAPANSKSPAASNTMITPSATRCLAGKALLRASLPVKSCIIVGLALLNSGCAVWNPWGYSEEWPTWKKTAFFVGPGHCPPCYVVGGGVIEIKRMMTGEKENDLTLAQEISPTGIAVLYLHGTARCDTCRQIEQIAAETVRESFAEAIAAGTVSWQAIDYDLPQNESVYRTFKPPCPSLILSTVSAEGQFGQFKILEQTWSLLDDSAAAVEAYVQQELQSFMQERLAVETAATPEDSDPANSGL